jgi:hypothetical protein
MPLPDSKDRILMFTSGVDLAFKKEIFYDNLHRKS